ncbi:MAG: transglycosylase domain-containing protein [Bacilli bacterium]|nr:transglycosylase domain-containing protein [Bacilli bacterium]
MKKFKKLLFIFTILGVICTIIYGGIYLYAWLNPKLAINNANSYYFYDTNENLITGTDEWIGYDNIDKDIINATIAIEDRHFFTHQGFDYLRILKALYNNILSNSISEGASTITQQYAKNLYLDFDKTLTRKINEAWLTLRLETHYTKEEIIEGYLNTINYGGIFGVENASKYYFGKSASDLSIAEASLLAGIPNRPSEYSPFVNLESSKKRQKTVLNSMVRDGYITIEESNNAYNEELTFNDPKNNNSLSSVMYFQDAVIEELKTIDSIPSSLITTGGLKIYTTYDPKAQESIESTIKETITNDIQVASIIMKPNGEILGLVGGVDYSKSQYNRALYSTRSVGSTIKPFLYYSALENNFTPSTTFTSEKTTFVFSEDQTYSPTNYGDTYPNKEISMAAAIAYSDNIYAVKTHLFLGSDNLVEMMKRVGVTSKLDSIPSLALGSQAISLLDMTKSYAVLANEGKKVEPYFIKKVVDINGNVLYERKDVDEVILNKSITYILSELLSNATNQNFIDYSYPTGYGISYKLTKKYAIKTGTTDFDHLVFGYNKDIVVGIWSGYDDNREITNTDANTNKSMWADIIEKYLSDKTDNWYSMPNNVVGVLVDPISGTLATEKNKKATILYYIKGTEPSNNYNLDDLVPTIKVDE